MLAANGKATIRIDADRTSRNRAVAPGDERLEVGGRVAVGVCKGRHAAGERRPSARAEAQAGRHDAGRRGRDTGEADGLRDGVGRRILNGHGDEERPD